MIEPAADRCRARNLETVTSPTVVFMRFFPVLKVYGKQLCWAITMLRPFQTLYPSNRTVNSLRPTMETASTRLPNRSADVPTKPDLLDYVLMDDTKTQRRDQ